MSPLARSDCSNSVPWGTSGATRRCLGQHVAIGCSRFARVSAGNRSRCNGALARETVLFAFTPIGSAVRARHRPPFQLSQSRNGLDRAHRPERQGPKADASEKDGQREQLPMPGNICVRRAKCIAVCGSHKFAITVTSRTKPDAPAALGYGSSWATRWQCCVHFKVIRQVQRSSNFTRHLGRRPANKGPSRDAAEDTPVRDHHV